MRVLFFFYLFFFLRRFILQSFFEPSYCFTEAFSEGREFARAEEHKRNNEYYHQFRKSKTKHNNLLMRLDMATRYVSYRFPFF
jgi:hypothetical protein